MLRFPKFAEQVGNTHDAQFCHEAIISVILPLRLPSRPFFGRGMVVVSTETIELCVRDHSHKPITCYFVFMLFSEFKQLPNGFASAHCQQPKDKFGGNAPHFHIFSIISRTGRE